MKKKLAIFSLCLFFFVMGWTFRYLYTTMELPGKTKEIQRRELRKTLKLRKDKLSDMVIIEEKDMGGYTRKLLRFRWQGLSHEAYLLIPNHQKGKVAAILAIHGHHTTKEALVGIKDSRFGVRFGLGLVKSGFCVLAPDIPFSEDMRVEDHVALNLIMAGTSLTGMRVSYLKTLLDYLSALSFVDPEKLGCIGWSMGGGLTMYLSAVDERVKVVAISSYFGTYKDTFMKLRSSTDNYIPGILSFGEMADVACLVVPRPLWFENGTQDEEFPEDAFLQGIETLKKCYAGFEERLAWQLIPGGHGFKGEGIEEWFKKWL